jgi:hypothetical protein
MPIWKFDTISSPGKTDFAPLSDIFFRKINTDNMLQSNDMSSSTGTYAIDSYDDILYLDLETYHEADSAFTLSLDFMDPVVNMERPVNYLTFGHHMRGRTGTSKVATN